MTGESSHCWRWRRPSGTRGGRPRQARLIRQASTDLMDLNGPDATAVGLLLARTATADIVILSTRMS
jgi:hypothetical protein